MPTAVDFAGPYDDIATGLNEENWGEFIRAGRGDGVVWPGLEVTAGAGLSVDVATGIAVVNGVLVRVDSTKNVTVAAVGGSGRRDTVVVRSTSGSNTAELDVKQGTDSIYPTLQQDSSVWEFPLAYLDHPASSGSVEAGHITDRRLDPSVPRFGVTNRMTVGDQDGDHVILGSTGRIYSPDGSVGSPTRAWKDDTDTGWSRESAGVEAFSSNGTKAVQLDGEGVKAVDGSAAAPSLSFFNNPNDGWYFDDAQDVMGLAKDGVEQGLLKTRQYTPEIEPDGDWVSQLTGSTATGRYVQLGPLLIVSASVELNGLDVGNTGIVGIGLPTGFSYSFATQLMGICYLRDSSTSANYVGTTLLNTTDNCMNFWRQDGLDGSVTGYTGLSPFTMQSGDVAVFNAVLMLNL